MLIQICNEWKYVQGCRFKQSAFILWMDLWMRCILFHAQTRAQKLSPVSLCWRQTVVALDRCWVQRVSNKGSTWALRVMKVFKQAVFSFIALQWFKVTKYMYPSPNYVLFLFNAAIPLHFRGKYCSFYYTIFTECSSLMKILTICLVI